ncbi:hypothetical protein K2173_018482 [Erythroxylum novogranatense]|uniref:FLZ-type domain-containing protein n=1 Tax=Erythroxylum novogranatense TaxID=1862640 RepID=A0AAV8UAS3_9ROSI|nr:hypothetical protein K2173_018482 [Erythroxylum novogranatense]
MLRNRSRTVTSKQSRMTDHSSQSPSAVSNTKQTTFFLGSPRFKAFIFKGVPETEPVRSPTSILETSKRISPLKNPFWCDSNQPKSPRFVPENKRSWEKLDTKGIVAVIDDIRGNEPVEKDGNPKSKPGNRAILFGTKLRVQIPPLPNVLSPVESPTSPGDFGIKTRNREVLSGLSMQAKDSPRAFTGCLSIGEMELSEDYTCVITHGPNPKTTHIFDNCIVESYTSDSATNGFLSFCHTCRKPLEPKNDIYMYRGEKGFCSHECRHQEMLLDDGVEN